LDVLGYLGEQGFRIGNVLQDIDANHEVEATLHLLYVGSDIAELGERSMHSLVRLDGVHGNRWQCFVDRPEVMPRTGTDIEHSLDLVGASDRHDYVRPLLP